MEQEIRDRYNKTILFQALSAYEIAENETPYLDYDFESFNVRQYS